jgi:hypothetical protein
MMMPMKARVASQMIVKTVYTSSRLTTPKAKALNAPITAVVPICNPRGCQMTRISVTRKRREAVSIG